jgi:hypothetical protein
MKVKSEIRNPKSEAQYKRERREVNGALALRYFSGFGVRISFGFRISDFEFDLASRQD